LLTNAAGSLNRKFQAGSVMIINDHVNMTGNNPLIGKNPVGDDGRALGPRFPDMSEVYDKHMRRLLRECSEARGLSVNEGIYLGLMGPNFETPSEVSLYASWGMGAVGMSTVWEAIALKHAGATVAGLSMISNLGCGLSDQPLSHVEVEETGRKVGRQILETLFEFAGFYVRNI
jgi:purine-nucleoside phosphorylase